MISINWNAFCTSTLALDTDIDVFGRDKILISFQLHLSDVSCLCNLLLKVFTVVYIQSETMKFVNDCLAHFDDSKYHL